MSRLSAFDASPAFSGEAVAWLTGPAPGLVWEHGAPAPSRSLAELGHRVLTGSATLPADRLLDVALCAWPVGDEVLMQVARSLRAGGHLAVFHHVRDERVPWVRRLGRILGAGEQPDPTQPIAASGLYRPVEHRAFRSWRRFGPDDLRRLAGSDDPDVVPRLDALYDEYRSGPDGLLMPLVTHCYRAQVSPVVPRADRHRADIHPAIDGAQAGADADDATHLFSLS